MKISWTPRIVLLLLLRCLTCFSALSGAELEWPLSIKFVLDTNGNRAATGDLRTDASISNTFVRANTILDSYGRGYRFKIVEITNLHGDDLPAPPATLLCCTNGFPPDATNGCSGGPTNSFSQWFDVPSFSAADDLYIAATNDMATFAWRTNAFNIYILGSQYSGSGGVLGGRPVVLGQQLTRDNSPFHEMGHTLGLCHTHGCSFGGSSPDEDTIGDDGVSDTLDDNSGWDTPDEIATHNFGGRTYAQLNGDEKAQVDGMLYNLMANHLDYQIITQGQLDRMTDTSNRGWPDFVNGRTWFVDAFAGGGVAKTTVQSGSSVEPYHTVAAGLSAADSGDIVLIRPGHYNERLTITEPVILRAPTSSAQIGTAH